MYTQPGLNEIMHNLFVYIWGTFDEYVFDT